jgi:hypothetical protein
MDEGTRSNIIARLRLVQDSMRVAEQFIEIGQVSDGKAVLDRSAELFGKVLWDVVAAIADSRREDGCGVDGREKESTSSGTGSSGTSPSV